MNKNCIILFLLLAIGCREIKKEYVNQIIPSRVEFAAPFRKILKKPFQFEQTGNATSFYYLESDSLYKAVLPDAEVSIYLPNLIDFTHVDLHDDCLMVMDGEKGIVEIYKIDYPDKKISDTKIFRVQDIFDRNASSLIYSQEHALYFQDSLIYLKFGKYFKSSNYLGKNIFYRLTYNDRGLSLKDSIFSYPRSIRTKERHEKTTWLYACGKDKLACGYVSDDHIEIIDLETGKGSEKLYTEYSQFKQYDDDSKDLGYIRHYDFTNERNIYQAFINNKFVILKRLQTKSLSDIPRYDLYVLSNDLTLLSLSKVPFAVGESIFPYENGIVISDRLGKFYYYEI